MKLFPSQYYFDRPTETLFQIEILKKTTRSTEFAGILILCVLTIFFIIDLSNWSADFFYANVIRAVETITVITMLSLNRFVFKMSNRIVWICGAFILIICFCGVFYFIGQAQGELKEGGPMLVVVGFAMIPIFDLREKLALWLLLGIGLFIQSIVAQYDMRWVLFYYAFTMFLAGILQYQIDILLRVQYRAEKAEAHKAITDQLTGTFNRHGLDEYLTTQIHALASSEYLHLMMLDVDHFKKYNDHYGHIEGDMVLTQLASLFVGLETDRVVRFGGEEFILLQTTTEKNPRWIEQINQRVMELNIAHVKSETTDVITVSCGVISATNQSNITTKDLLTKADELLYSVKHNGRNATKQVFI